MTSESHANTELSLKTGLNAPDLTVTDYSHFLPITQIRYRLNTKCCICTVLSSSSSLGCVQLSSAQFFFFGVVQKLSIPILQNTLLITWVLLQLQYGNPCSHRHGGGGLMGRKRRTEGSLSPPLCLRGLGLLVRAFTSRWITLSPAVWLPSPSNL